MKKLTVVIVNYNVRHYVDQCLDSLSRALEGMDAEVYVVDNHSSDGSVGFLRRRHPGVKFVENHHNLGFAKANNYAMRRAQGEYVLLLNPDTFVGEDTLRKAVAFMDAHPRAGGVGVKMYNSDGSVAMESRRGLPTPLTSFYKMCGLCSAYPRHRRFGRYYLCYLPWDSPQRIEVVSGAFCLLRHAALDRIGLLDEDFFMYGEDIDLSFRLLKGGYENWYLPLPILHYKGESTQKSSFRYVHVFYNAMLIFFRKHYGHLSFLLTWPIRAAIYFKAALALLVMMSRRMRKSLGFVSRESAKTPAYLLVGGKEMRQACGELAADNGLSIAGSVGVDGMPAGDVSDDDETLVRRLSQEEPMRTAGESVVVVFDMDTFSYARVLAVMERLAQACRGGATASLGTYSRRLGRIISNEEVIG